MLPALFPQQWQLLSFATQLSPQMLRPSVAEVCLSSFSGIPSLDCKLASVQDKGSHSHSASSKAHSTHEPQKQNSVQSSIVKIGAKAIFDALKLNTGFQATRRS